MKKNSASGQIFALPAMLALFVAAYFTDQWLTEIRSQAANDFNIPPAWWLIHVIDLLIVLLTFLVGVWILFGSARSRVNHWLFFIVGLVISFYMPLVVLGSFHGLPAFYQVPALWGENVLFTARILASAGLLGLLLKPQKWGEN